MDLESKFENPKVLLLLVPYFICFQNLIPRSSTTNHSSTVSTQQGPISLTGSLPSPITFSLSFPKPQISLSSAPKLAYRASAHGTSDPLYIPGSSLTLTLNIFSSSSLFCFLWTINH